jgi:ubiquitin-like protein Pup
MADQEKGKRRRRTKGDAPSGDGDGSGLGMAQVSSDKIDDLLEEIDSVLEENAEEFVKNYIQKGGE